MPSSCWKCLLSLSHFKNLLRHCAKTVFRHKHGLSTWYWDAYLQKSSFTGSFKDLSKSNHQLVKLDWRTLWMALLSHLFSPLPAQNPSPGWSPSQWGTGGEFLAGSGPAPLRPACHHTECCRLQNIPTIIASIKTAKIISLLHFPCQHVCILTL